MYYSPVLQGGASWSLPLSSSKAYYQEQQCAQPSVYSSGHHACKPKPVTTRFSRVAQRAYTQQIREYEIFAGIQNLNLSANPSHSSKNFAAGENRLSRSSLRPREVSPPGLVSPGSKSASAASYNPVGYRNEGKTPPTARPRRPKSKASKPSASHHSQSSARWRNEPVLGSPVGGDYGQRLFYDSSTPGDSPRPSDDSQSVSDSPRSSHKSWSDYYNDVAPPDYDDFSLASQQRKPPKYLNQ